jgi:hypothetical protein
VRRSIVAQLGAGDAQFGAKSAQLGAIRPLQRGAHAGVDDDSVGKVGIGRRGSGMDDDALRGSFEEAMRFKGALRKLRGTMRFEEHRRWRSSTFAILFAW